MFLVPAVNFIFGFKTTWLDVRRYIAFTAVLAVTRQCCSCLEQLPGGRLVDFPLPDYRFTFPLSSQNGIKSFKQIEHGLAKLPFHLNVKVSAKEGDSSGYNFEGSGASQNAGNSGNYGGVLFAYSERSVRIWAPTEYAGNTNGRIIFVSDGWGGDKFTQSSSSADVTVEAWKDGPEPNFQMSYEVDTRRTSQPYIHQHRLHQLPSRVSVRVTALFPNEQELFYFHAAGSSQNPPNTQQFGGITFAYNENYVKIWLPSSRTGSKKLSSGCITVGKGWGAGAHSSSMFTTQCRIEVRLWVHSFPPPSFQTDWQPFDANAHELSFREIHHNLNQSPLYVLVQVKHNNTQGSLIFEGIGSVMATEFTNAPYGGVLFAYNNKTVHLWAPSSNRNASGRIALISYGWGRQEDLVAFTKGLVRVLIYTNLCHSNNLTSDGQRECRTFDNTQLTWTTSPWASCSKTCGRGKQKRSVNGCHFSQSELKFSCDFELDFCGFKSSRFGPFQIAWGRTRGQLYSPKDQDKFKNNGFFLHAFGYPKGSWFVYSDTRNSSSSVGSLTSPDLHNGDNCYLQFMYRTGVYFGALRVDVTKDDRVWEEAWRMGDDQLRNSEIWVNGYVNIGNRFPYSIKHFRFVHSQEGCGSVCMPVAIDQVRLYCDVDQQAISSLPRCKERALATPGCVINAFDPVKTGDAFTIVDTDKGTFVSAQSNRSHFIAMYLFNVVKHSNYTVWIETFSSSLFDNSVWFSINNGSWIRWDVVSKKGSLVWNVYFRKSFEFAPGIHSFSLKEYEREFRYRNIRIVPKELLVWSDLGMQSHHIDDSRLMSSLFLSTELEDGQYARLHGFGGWWPREQNVGSLYLMISLTDVALINKIATQGGTSTINPAKIFCHTSSYKIKVSIDGIHFAFYRNQTGREHLFAGNNDSNTVVMHTLQYSVIAKSVRIYPWSLNDFSCMRIELYGSYFRGGMCPKVKVKPLISQACDGERNCGENAQCRHVEMITGREGPMTADEKCVCKTGFHGDSCQYIGCSPNPCKNDAICQVRGKKFYCVCPLGFYGHKCEKQCPAGTYGYGCRLNCTCQAHSTCDPINGSCSCNPGYIGATCNISCPKGTYGSNCSEQCRCSDITICDHVSGDCLCKAGFSGDDCETPCVLGFYGRNCTQRCSCKHNATCNPVDGSCKCGEGWYGDICSLPCPNGTYGPGCVEQCSCSQKAICNGQDGLCTCFGGWKGLNCTERCREGRFGINCLQRCSCRRRNTKSCNPVNGDCSCKDGYSGARCRRACPIGTFGPSCRNMCLCQNDGRCDSVTGQCTCDSGYVGQYCEHRCPPTRFGRACAQNCECNTNQTIRCDFKDGSCFCKPGFHGVHCESPCPVGQWGKNCVGNCNCNYGFCSPMYGFCTCHPGWRGWDCKEQCNASTYGAGCKSMCACKNGAMCSRFDGSCNCKRGYRGKFCEDYCSNNTFGIDCRQNCTCSAAGTTSCDPISGRCSCQLGFYGRNCNDTCPDGSFGRECLNRCIPCPHSQGSCDKRHGNCSCLPGFYGYACLDDCDWFHFGHQCAARCSCREGYLCNNVNGNCYEAALYTVDVAILSKPLRINTLYKNGSRLIKRNFEMMLGKWDLALNPASSRSDRSSFGHSTAATDRFIMRIVKAKRMLGNQDEDVILLNLSILDHNRPVLGKTMTETMQMIGSVNVSSSIGFTVYTGQLRHIDDSGLGYIKWIITGSASGLAVVVFISLVFLWRRYHQPISSIYKVKRNSIDMELRPFLGASGHVLAFDNPYYDVIAAMGLDDDIEEDYYNPLYDDSSIYDDEHGSDTDGFYHNDEVPLYPYDRDSGISSGTF